MAKSYSEVSRMSRKSLVLELNGMDTDGLADLLKQCQQRYLYYSEEVKKYSSSKFDDMLYAGEISEPRKKQPDDSKGKKEEVVRMTTAQFLDLEAKISRCEQITGLVIGTIAFKEAMTKMPAEEVKSLKKEMDEAKRLGETVRKQLRATQTKELVS